MTSCINEPLDSQCHDFEKEMPSGSATLRPAAGGTTPPCEETANDEGPAAPVKEGAPTKSAPYMEPGTEQQLATSLDTDASGHAIDKSEHDDCETSMAEKALAEDTPTAEDIHVSVSAIPADDSAEEKEVALTVEKEATALPEWSNVVVSETCTPPTEAPTIVEKCAASFAESTENIEQRDDAKEEGSRLDDNSRPEQSDTDTVLDPCEKGAMNTDPLDVENAASLPSDTTATGDKTCGEPAGSTESTDACVMEDETTSPQVLEVGTPAVPFHATPSSSDTSDNLTANANSFDSFEPDTKVISPGSLGVAAPTLLTLDATCAGDGTSGVPTANTQSPDPCGTNAIITSSGALECTSSATFDDPTGKVDSPDPFVSDVETSSPGSLGVAAPTLLTLDATCTGDETSGVPTANTQSPDPCGTNAIITSSGALDCTSSATFDDPTSKVDSPDPFVNDVETSSPDSIQIATAAVLPHHTTTPIGDISCGPAANSDSADSAGEKDLEDKSEVTENESASPLVDSPSEPLKTENEDGLAFAIISISDEMAEDAHSEGTNAEATIDENGCRVLPTSDILDEEKPTDPQPEHDSVSSDGDLAIVRAASNSLDCRPMVETSVLTSEAPPAIPQEEDLTMTPTDTLDRSPSTVENQGFSKTDSSSHLTSENAISDGSTNVLLMPDMFDGANIIDEVGIEPNSERSAVMDCEATDPSIKTSDTLTCTEGECDRAKTGVDDPEASNMSTEGLAKSERAAGYSDPDVGPVTSTLNVSERDIKPSSESGKDGDGANDKVQEDKSQDADCSRGSHMKPAADYRLDPPSQNIEFARDDNVRLQQNFVPGDAESNFCTGVKPDPPEVARVVPTWNIDSTDPLSAVSTDNSERNRPSAIQGTANEDTADKDSADDENKLALETEDSRQRNEGAIHVLSGDRNPSANGESDGAEGNVDFDSTTKYDDTFEVSTSAVEADDDCSYEEIIVEDDDDMVEYVDEILDEYEEECDDESFTEITYNSKDFEDDALQQLQQSKGSITVDASMQKRQVIKSSAQKAFENEEAKKLKEAEETRKNMEFRLARQHSFARKDEELKRRLEEEEARHIREEEERERQRLNDQIRLAEIRAQEAAARIARQETAELRRRLEEEEARRKLAEAEAHRLAAEAAAKEKAEADKIRREAEESEKRAREERKRQMEEEIRKLQEKLAATKRAAEEAKAKQLEEQRRVHAVVDARRKEKKVKKKKSESAVPLTIQSGTIDQSQLAELNASASSVRGPSPTPLLRVPVSSRSPVTEPQSPEASATVTKPSPVQSHIKVVPKSPAAPPKSPLPASPRRLVMPTSPSVPSSPLKMHQPPLPSPTLAPKVANPPTAPNLSTAMPMAGKVYYSAEQLRKQSVPGLDYKNREQYLHPDEFEKIFEMSPTEFFELPAWKQTTLKRKKKLF